MDRIREGTIGVRDVDCSRFACTGLSKHTRLALVDLHTFYYYVYKCANKSARRDDGQECPLTWYRGVGLMDALLLC